MLTHGNLRANNEQSLSANGHMNGDDVVYCVLPVFHIFGLNVVLGLALTSKLLRQLVHRAPEQLYELLEHQGRLRNFGAQALQLCYVAAGRLSAAASLETSLWDNAAGALIVREAGGLYTDLSGNDPFPLMPGAPALKGGRSPCLAASPKAHARLLPFLRRAV